MVLLASAASGIDKPGEAAMLNKTMSNKTRIALSVMLVLGTASGAFAKNQGTMYTDPDSTPNGPFFYANTFGVPPSVLHQAHQPRHPARKPLASRADW
jgi:hypothetical protein